MQGSKISKPEGCGEDGEGGYAEWWGLALFVCVCVLCSNPSPGSPEKITERADSSRLPALPSDWLRRASRCWRWQQGVRGGFQPLSPLSSRTAGRPRGTSGSRKTTCGIGGALAAHAAQHTLARVTLKKKHAPLLFFFFFTSQRNINALGF